MQVVEQVVPRDADNVILVRIVSDFQVLQGVPLISFERAGPGQCEARNFSLSVELLLFMAVRETCKSMKAVELRVVPRHNSDLRSNHEVRLGITMATPSVKLVQCCAC